MYIGCYFRVSREELPLDFRSQQKLVQKEIDEAGRVRTIMYFADGTSRELSDAEIKMIFNMASKGEKYIIIEKPRRTCDYKGYLVRRRISELQHKRILPYDLPKK